MEVLRRLEEVGRTIPQNCTVTKLELIAAKEEVIQQIQVEHQRRVTEYQTQLTEKGAQIGHLQLTNNHLRTENDRLQAESQAQQQEIKTLSEAEKQEQACILEELTAPQQQQLEDQCREIERLSGQIRSLKVQPRKEGSQGSGQRDVAILSSNKVKQRS